MEYLNLNGTGLDKVYTINKIKNPDVYLYFCHLKNEVFIDETDLPEFMQNLEKNIASSKVYNIKFDYM